MRRQYIVNSDTQKRWTSLTQQKPTVLLFVSDIWELFKLKKNLTAFISLIILVFIVTGCSGGGGGSAGSSQVDPSPSPTFAPNPSPTPVDYIYRDEMRQFVQDISAYAKTTNPAFIIIPQNAQALFTDSGLPGGKLSTEYLTSIDGTGRESLFYGENGIDSSNPASYSNQLTPLLNLGKSRGLTVLVTDYCYSTGKVDDSFSKNDNWGYIGFAADRAALDTIPTYPVLPHKVNDNYINSLLDIRNFLYIINPGRYEKKEDFLAALQKTDFDLLVIDAFFDGSEPLTASEVYSLKNRANGGRRLVIAYMSIGEAENYRYYWNPDWVENPPEWLEAENPQWPGNYKVRYWFDEWKHIIYGNNESYTKIILDAGFDGVYLDVVDGYEYFEAMK